MDFLHDIIRVISKKNHSIDYLRYAVLKGIILAIWVKFVETQMTTDIQSVRSTHACGRV